MIQSQFKSIIFPPLVLSNFFSRPPYSVSLLLLLISSFSFNYLFSLSNCLFLVYSSLHTWTISFLTVLWSSGLTLTFQLLDQKFEWYHSCSMFSLCAFCNLLNSHCELSLSVFKVFLGGILLLLQELELAFPKSLVFIIVVIQVLILSLNVQELVSPLLDFILNGLLVISSWLLLNIIGFLESYGSQFRSSWSILFENFLSFQSFLIRLLFPFQVRRPLFVDVAF